MKTATDLMFIKLNKEEICELIEPVLQKTDAILKQPKKFTVSDLWYIHRQRKFFERRRNIFSK